MIADIPTELRQAWTRFAGLRWMSVCGIRAFLVHDSKVDSVVFANGAGGAGTGQRVARPAFAWRRRLPVHPLNDSDLEYPSGPAPGLRWPEIDVVAVRLCEAVGLDSRHRLVVIERDGLIDDGVAEALDEIATDELRCVANIMRGFACAAGGPVLVTTAGMTIEAPGVEVAAVAAALSEAEWMLVSAALSRERYTLTATPDGMRVQRASSKGI